MAEKSTYQEQTTHNSLEERRRLYLLKQILLKDDRDELEKLKKTLENPNLLSEKVKPIIEDHFEFLKKNFPEEFRYAVEGIIEQKLEQSQEQMLNIIYPKVGLMIKKYVQHEFQQLKENLEAIIDRALNQGIVGRLKGAFSSDTSKKMSAAILKNVFECDIEEIYVIEHHSGILLGSASRGETIDIDVIAGMLTAIKSFVEDAFKRGDEQLEMVQYGTFTILLQNFHSYYIAAAISGPISNQDRMQISENLMKFASEELNINIKKEDGSSNYLIKKRLEQYFFNSQKQQQSIQGKK